MDKHSGFKKSLGTIKGLFELFGLEEQKFSCWQEVEGNKSRIELLIEVDHIVQQVLKFKEFYYEEIRKQLETEKEQQIARAEQEKEAQERAKKWEVCD